MEDFVQLLLHRLPTEKEFELKLPDLFSGWGGWGKTRPTERSGEQKYQRSLVARNGLRKYWNVPDAVTVDFDKFNPRVLVKNGNLFSRFWIDFPTTTTSTFSGTVSELSNKKDAKITKSIPAQDLTYYYKKDRLFLIPYYQGSTEVDPNTEPSSVLMSQIASATKDQELRIKRFIPRYTLINLEVSKPWLSATTKTRTVQMAPAPDGVTFAYNLVWLVRQWIMKRSPWLGKVLDKLQDNPGFKMLILQLATIPEGWKYLEKQTLFSQDDIHGLVRKIALQVKFPPFLAFRPVDENLKLVKLPDTIDHAQEEKRAISEFGFGFVPITKWATTLKKEDMNLFFSLDFVRNFFQTQSEIVRLSNDQFVDVIRLATIVLWYDVMK